MGRFTTLLWLRSRLWWNGLRSGARLADNAAAVILALIGGVLSVAMVLALGVITNIGFRSGEPDGLRVALIIVFWMFGFFGVVLPLFVGFRQNIPIERLLVYPFSLPELYRVSLTASGACASHLFWYPAMVAVTVVAVIANRIPPLACLAIVLLLSACLVVWCHTILLAVQGVFRQRSARELVALIVLVGVVLVSMVPALMESRMDEGAYENLSLPAPIVSAIARAASVFPPSIAVAAIMAAENDSPRMVAMWLGALALWLVAGVVLGEKVFRHAVDGGAKRASSAGGSSTKTPRFSAMSMIEGFVPLPAASGAVAERELLYLLRSVPGKFSIMVMPIFVIVMGLVLARDMTGQYLGLDRSSLVFVGVMVYCSMFSNNFVYNAYAWEGAGIRSYFITPSTPRQVVFGKNLGVWLFNLLLLLECLVAYVAVVGLPQLSAAVSGCLAFVAAILLSTTTGNFVSPALPVARDISKVTNSPSQTGVLVSLGMLVVHVLLIGGLAAIGALSNTPWLLPLLLAALVALLGFAYRWLLGPASRLLEERRESLVEAVQITG